MLLGDFFKLIQFESTSVTLQATVSLDSNHAVFAGHFPGQPVVPGVMQIQLIRELLEKVTGSALFMNKIDSVKYLVPIDPRLQSYIQVITEFALTEGDSYKISAMIQAENIIFTRIKAHLQIC